MLKSHAVDLHQIILSNFQLSIYEYLATPEQTFQTNEPTKQFDVEGYNQTFKKNPNPACT